MAQEKWDQRGKPGARSRRESGSQLSLSDQERAKATIEDIDELYSALQDLVPKPGKQVGRKARGRTSGTDTDTTRDCEDSDRSQGRYSNGRVTEIQQWNNMSRKAGNMRSLEVILDRESKEKRVQLPNDRMFVSDTELESSERHRQLQRCASLPGYDDVESTNEMADGNDAESAAPKKSLFLLFRRRPGTKTKKKKRPSWRTFLASLNFKRKSTKKRKKKSINKSSEEVVSTRESQPANASVRRRQSREKTAKKLSSSRDEGVEKITQDVSTATVEINRDTARESFKKSKAPEPPAQGNLSKLGTRSDEVTRKLSAWYKHVVKETTSLNDTAVLPARYSRSCESLLTDTEILRNRVTSDTESAGANDIRSRMNMNKIRVRKSRAMRNRRKERARWRSLPNVKLVSYALDKANGRETSTGDVNDKEKEPTEVSHHEERLPTKYTATTVKPVEAELSFENNLEKKKSSESPMKDFMMVHTENNPSWLSRQCTKTTISCIRPLQLNLFYSESPSREAKFRSEKPKFQFKGSKSPNEAATTPRAQPLPSAFKIRQTSSQRRRKRRSLKRQPRLPQQSPFYLPSPTSTTSKFSFKLSNQETSLEVDESAAPSKDSGIGSPDHEKKTFRVEAINTSERRRVPKLYWESEDSGWASMDKSPASHANTGMQTEPVLIMTVDSKARRNRFVPQAIGNDSDGQSEA